MSDEYQPPPRAADDVDAIRKRMDELAAERTRGLQSACVECSGVGFIVCYGGWAECPTCRNPRGNVRPA